MVEAQHIIGYDVSEAARKNAEEKLNSAGNWGIFDMFGGGLFSTIIKRSKMDDAQNLMETAKTDLMIFQKELKDINIPLNLRVEVGSFLSFADFFLDGFVADYLVQSKITDAKSQVSDAIYRVEQLLRELKRKNGDV